MTEPSAPAVVVLGSVHMDLIAMADRLPEPGESVTGGRFTMAPGGKGGNQACQFALAGARSSLASRVGDDMFGSHVIAALKAKSVDTTLIAIDEAHATGASPVLATAADYASIIVPGAASRLSTADIDGMRPALANADALAIQLELPVELAAHTAAIASAIGKRMILNASPAPAGSAALPEALWRATSILVVNRMEAGRLLGRAVGPASAEDDAGELAGRLGIATVIITLGDAGVIAVSGGETVRQPAFPTTVVDPVGAGDAFLGVCATALLEARPIADAVRRGAAAATLALSRAGVYDALPSRAEVDAFLSAR